MNTRNIGLKKLLTCVGLFLLLFATASSLRADDPSGLKFTLDAATAVGKDHKVEIPRSGLVPVTLKVEAQGDLDQLGPLVLQVSGFRASDISPAASPLIPVRISKSDNDFESNMMETEIKAGTISFFFDATRILGTRTHRGKLSVMRDDETLASFSLSLTRNTLPAPLFQWKADGGARVTTLKVPDLGSGYVLLDLPGLHAESSTVVVITPHRFLRDGSGEEAKLAFEIPKHPSISAASREVPSGSTQFEIPDASLGHLAVGIDATDLEPGKTYRGWISVSTWSGEAKTGTHRHHYQVVREKLSKTGRLVVSGPRVVEEVSWGKASPRILLTLDEANGEALQRLRVRHTGGDEEGASFGSSEGLDVKLYKDGKLVQSLSADECKGIDLWDSNLGPASDRSLLDGEQASILISPKEKLWWGEYKVKIQLQADNVAPENYEEIELTYRVLQPRIYPTVALISCVILSYFMSRGIGFRLRHDRLQRKVRAILDRGRSIFGEESVRTRPPVVQVRVELERIKRALKRSGPLFRLVSIPADLEKRLEIVEKRIPVLQDLAEQCKYWANVPDQNEWVKRRAERVLRKVAMDLAASPDTGEFDKKDLDKLAELEHWQDPNKLAELYWLHLKQDIMKLKARFLFMGFEGPETSKVGDALMGLRGVLENYEAAQRAFLALTDLVPKAVLEGASLPKLTDLVKVEVEPILAAVTRVATLENQLEGIGTKGLGDFQSSVNLAMEAIATLKIKEYFPLIDAAKSELEVLETAKPDDLKLIETAKKACEVLSPTYTPEDQLREIEKGIREAENTPRERLRKRIFNLMKVLERPPADVEEAVGREKEFTALKLILKYRGRGNAVVNNYRAKMISSPDTVDIDEFLKVIDVWAWSDLLNNMKITKPAQEEDYQELKLIDFQITPENRAAEYHYLYKHGLDYSWDVSTEDGLPRKHRSFWETLLIKQPFKFIRPKMDTWKGTKTKTQEPLVSQFVPYGFEKISVTTTVSYPHPEDLNDSKSECSFEVKAVEFKTSQNAELRWRNTFQKGDVIAVVLAVFVAVLTGLREGNFLEQTRLGSFGAYLSLAAWGVVSENLTKHLKNFRAGSDD